MELDAPRFTTRQMLSCIPGLDQKVYATWVTRGIVKPQSAYAGRGRRPLFTGRDVIQLATAYELSRFGLLQWTQPVWLFAVEPALTSRRLGFPRRDVWALIASDAAGKPVIRFANLDDPADDGGLSRDDSPDAFVVFRVERFIDHIVSRIEGITP